MGVRPGYKQTEVGAIPDDWRVINIAGGADMITVGFVGSMAHLFTKTGVPLLRGQDVEPNNLNLSNTEFISVETHKLWKKSALAGGDVVIVRVGASAGMACVIPHDIGDANAASLVVIRPSPKNLDASFLSQLINSYIGLKQIESLLVGGAQPVINTGTASNFMLALPAIDEQHAIAAALSDVDALLDGLERLIVKKRDLKQAAMQQLLTGQTRLPNFSGAWEVKRLGELADMGSGGTPLSSVTAYYDGDIPWVAISDMTKGGKTIESTERNLTALGLANSAAQMFPVGTVLYAMYASLGECSISGVPLCTSQAILGIRPKSSLNFDYLYYYLTSLKSIVKTLGQHGTQANLNKSMVQDFRLALPSFAEQTAIATVLSDMDAELSALVARGDKTRALKQSMMQELLTGRTRLV